jgi:hypothetical protein
VHHAMWVTFTETRCNTKVGRDLDAELEQVDTKLAELRAEQEGLKVERLTWAEISENMTSVQEREHRKGILPRAIRAGELKLKELQRERAERDLVPIQQTVEETFAEREAIKAQIEELNQEFGRAQHAWSEALRRANRQQERIKELDQHIQLLNGVA